jgi:hypothetical protein
MILAQAFDPAAAQASYDRAMHAPLLTAVTLAAWCLLLAFVIWTLVRPPTPGGRP